MKPLRAIVAVGFLIVVFAGIASAQSPGAGPDPRGPVPQGLDLGLRATGPTTLTVGQTATFSLTVTNGGPSPAGPGDVEVTSVLPASFVAPLTASGSDWTCQAYGSTAICQYAGPPVGPGGALLPITLSARTATAGAFVQCASARAVRMEDLRPGDNRACVDGRIAGAPPERIDLAIQTRGPGPLTVGQSASFLLLVRNQGQAPVGATHGVQVIDRSPPGLTAIEGGGPNWNCGVSGAVLTCGYGGSSVGPGASFPPISVLVRAGGRDAYVQCAEVRVTRGGDANPGDNRICVRDLVRPDNSGDADLSVRETGPAALVAGQSATFVLWPRNKGPASVDVAGEVTITDTVPLVFDQVQASGPGWTCFLSSGAPVLVRCVYVGPPVGPGAPLPNVTIAALAKSDGPYLHCVEIGRRNGFDPTPDDNRFCLEGRVAAEGAGHDIGVALRTLGPMTEGQTASFALNPYNTGGASVNAASEVTLNITLPALFDLPTVNAGPGWSCVTGGSSPYTVSCGYAGAAVWANSQLPQIIVAAGARKSGPYQSCAEIDLKAARDLNPRDNRSCVEGEIAASSLTSP